MGKRGFGLEAWELAWARAMQILDPRALDAAAAEPLLSAPRSTAATAAALSGGGAHSGDGHGHGSAGYKPKPVKPGDLQFLSRFRALMALLRPWPALLLSLLSVAEALVVAEGAAWRDFGA